MAQSASPEEQRGTGSQAGALPERPSASDPDGPRDWSDSWAPSPPAQHPFVFQHGHQLFLLDGGAGDWVFAELRFERAMCRYVEVRRASYHWPREALSVLLSRIVTGGPDDHALLDRASAQFADWLSVQFQLNHH